MLPRCSNFLSVKSHLPLVSIIIPVYNGESYLRPTLEGVICQTHDRLEIIVCDDGSTDTTPLIVRQILDPRISYLRQSNSGVSAARNLGLSLSKGAYIIFLDSDDILPPDYVSKRVEYMISRRLDCLTGPVSLFGCSESKRHFMRGCSHLGVSEILLLHREVATTPSAYFFCNSFLRKHHLIFDESLSCPADRDFILRCLSHGRFAYEQNLPELFYRVSSDSMSNSRSRSLLVDLENYFNKLPRLLDQLNLTNSHIQKATLAHHALHLASISVRIGHYRYFTKYMILGIYYAPVIGVSRFSLYLFRILTRLSDKASKTTS